jgi:hypothetical protein
MKNLFESPYVNDVTNQIEMIKLILFEKLYQIFGAALLRGKVKV